MNNSVVDLTEDWDTMYIMTTDNANIWFAHLDVVDPTFGKTCGGALQV